MSAPVRGPLAPAQQSARGAARPHRSEARSEGGEGPHAPLRPSVQADREPIAFRAWAAFWLGTAIYFALAIADTKMHWHQKWIPQLGLYPATFALLFGFAKTDLRLRRWSETRIAVMTASLVTVAAAATGVRTPAT